MYLADFEQELVDYIYNILISNNESSFINLYGDTGCGKTTIALSIAGELQENWIVFYLEGLDSNLSPYLTWHIGTKIFSKKKLNLSGGISFGINYPPIPISLEFGGSVQLEATDYVLSPNEKVLIDNIKEQAGSNENILFIADDFEHWDMPSKQFLQKIMMPELKILNDFHVATIAVTQEKIHLNGIDSINYLPISPLSDESILFVLRQHGYSNRVNINEIRICAGNDLSLAIMASDYYSNHSEKIINVTEIIDKRYTNLSPEIKNACKLLEPLSIIDSYITKDMAAYFINDSQKDSLETSFLAEEYLLTAEEQLFISGEENFSFTTEKIKAYFKSKLKPVHIKLLQFDNKYVIINI